MLETARRFYNDLLAERKTAYEERQETVGKTAQLRRVKERKATNPYAAGVHSHLLQVVVGDLDRAFQAFFRRVQGEARRRATPASRGGTASARSGSRSTATASRSTAGG